MQQSSSSGNSNIRKYKKNFGKSKQITILNPDMSVSPDKLNKAQLKFNYKCNELLHSEMDPKTHDSNVSKKTKILKLIYNLKEFFIENHSD